MIRKYVSYGCTIYCAYQLGTYVYEQYIDDDNNKNNNERQKPKQTPVLKRITNASEQRHTSTQTDNIDDLNQVKNVTNQGTDFQMENGTGERLLMKKKQDQSRNSLLADIRKSKKGRTNNVKLNAGNNIIIINNNIAKKTSKSTVLKTSNQPRNSLLSDIRKFPRKKSLKAINKPKANIKSNNNKNNMKTQLPSQQQKRRKSNMPVNLLSDIRRRKSVDPEAVSYAKLLKKTYSCPPVRKLVKPKSSPNVIRKKSKERIALFASIQKSGKHILKKNNSNSEKRNDDEEDGKKEKRPSVPKMLLDDIKNLRKTQSSGATFWPRRTSLFEEIRSQKKKNTSKNKKNKTTPKKATKRMNMFEEMKLKKSNLRSVHKDVKKSNTNQQVQKEDYDPNISNGNVTTRKRRKRKKKNNNKGNDKSGSDTKQNELQKMLNRRKLGKSLKLTPEKKV